jgi:hypothetical protein
LPTYNLLGKEVTVGAGFDGLIYDIRITPFIVDPLQDLYHYTVCPRKEQLAEAVYFALQDGFDVSYADHTPAGGARAAVSGLSRLWYDYSYDDPTVVAATGILGDKPLRSHCRPSREVHPHLQVEVRPQQVAADVL